MRQHVRLVLKSTVQARRTTSSIVPDRANAAQIFGCLNVQEVTPCVSFQTAMTASKPVASSPTMVSISKPLHCVRHQSCAGVPCQVLLKIECKTSAKPSKKYVNATKDKIERISDLRGVVIDIITEVMGDGGEFIVRALQVSKESAVASNAAGKASLTPKSAVRSASLLADIVAVDVADDIKHLDSGRRCG